LTHARAKSLRPLQGHTMLTALLMTAGLLACSGQDIYRKGSHRKAKFLFAFPGRFATLQQHTGGKLGQLADLNTPNPSCFLDTAAGQIKLEGTIIPLKNRFFTMQCNPKAAKRQRTLSSTPAVSVEDVFDKLVVFSKVGARRIRVL
jgi:hypothetical protein